MYKCVTCKRVLEELDRLRCPFCGARIFIKLRPPTVKRVWAK